jgi:hypothetical protein
LWVSFGRMTSAASPSGRRYGGPNGYGHKDDPDDHMRTNVRVLFARMGVDHTTTPPSASNRAFGPGILDQGSGADGTGSCTGHAVIGAIFGTLGRAGTPQTTPGSPDWAYKIGRCIDRHPNPDGTRPLLIDDGAMPNQVMRGLREYGVVPMGPRPASGRFSDVSPATVNDEPDLGRVEQGAEFKLEGDYEIGPWDPNFIELVRAAIAAGFDVCFSIFCDTKGPRSVEGWDPKLGPLGAVATPGDRDGGRHYLYADGYRSLPTGKTIIEWANSWGTEWGLDGYGEGDESFMRGWANVVVMKVRKVQVLTPLAAAA